jgi:hypothetical protein
MQRQDRVPAEAEPAEPDFFNGTQRERRAILEEQHMTIVDRRSELNSIQDVLAAWMIVATIGLVAIFLL